MKYQDLQRLKKKMNSNALKKQEEPKPIKSTVTSAAKPPIK